MEIFLKKLNLSPHFKRCWKFENVYGPRQTAHDRNREHLLRSRVYLMLVQTFLHSILWQLPLHLSIIVILRPTRRRYRHNLQWHTHFHRRLSSKKSEQGLWLDFLIKFYAWENGKICPLFIHDHESFSLIIEFYVGWGPVLFCIQSVSIVALYFKIFHQMLPNTIVSVNLEELFGVEAHYRFLREFHPIYGDYKFWHETFLIQLISV